MTPDQFQNYSRRFLFQHTGTGLGGIALASLLQEDLLGRTSIGMHHPAKAKNVIYFHFVGAPSHLDLFEWKPELQKRDGQLCPDEFFKGKRLAFIRKQPKLLGTQKSDKFNFQRCGQSGAYISSLLPELQKKADELCFIRSMQTDHFNHAPAQLFLSTGFGQFGRPSIGSWLGYGLGSENRDLPAYIVLTSFGTGRPNDQPLYDRLWSSGFLPTKHQGVKFRNTGDAVLYLSNPPGVDRSTRRRTLDRLNALNQHRFNSIADPEISTRIAQYELAFRMQSSVPDLLDVSKESKRTLERYGPDVQKPGTYAANCLLARRMAERDVRFVQLFHMGWDHHGGLPKAVRGQCNDTDQATSALLIDLEERGLLEDTLVVWGGEFGRTIYSQGKLTATNYGRDHHPRCFTVLLAGAGIKGGVTLGETDDYCYNIIRDPVHVHDLNATILHLLGIDHEKLTYRHQGRDYRLTDVHGHLVNPILA